MLIAFFRCVRAFFSTLWRNRNHRWITALFCLALFLGIQGVAASGSLHEAIHHDAHSHGHECVFTLVTQGQIDVPATLFQAAAVTAVFLFCLPALNPAFFSSFDYRLSPSRAPPRF